MKRLWKGKKENKDNHISGELIYILCSFIVILTSYEMTVSINSYFDLLLPLEEKKHLEETEGVTQKVSEIATNYCYLYEIVANYCFVYFHV